MYIRLYVGFTPVVISIPVSLYGGRVLRNLFNMRILWGGDASSNIALAMDPKMLESLIRETRVHVDLLEAKSLGRHPSVGFSPSLKAVHISTGPLQ